MAKLRIYELAKELNRDPKDIISFLNADYKSVSGIEDEEAERVREHFQRLREKARKEAQERAQREAEKAQAAKRPPEKKADQPDNKQDETVKKKKTVFLFRPENSAAFSGNRGNNQRPADRNRQQERRPARPQEPHRNAVIKPSVPTTAEQYRQNLNETPEKQPVPEVKKENVPSAVIPEAVPEKKEEAVRTEAAAEVKPAAEERPAEEVKPAQAEAPAVPEEKKTEEKKPEEKKPESEQEVKPAVKEAPVKAPEKKESVPAAEKKTETPVKAPEKPQQRLNVFEQARKNAQEKAPIIRENIYRNMAKANAERAKQSDARRNTTLFRPGTGRPGTGTGRPQGGGNGRAPFGQGQGQGNRPQGQNRRPQGSFGPNAGGQNRGGFAPDAQRAQAAPGRSDQRKQNTGNRNDKNKNRAQDNRDRVNKKAENFRNLSKNAEKNRKPLVQKEEETIRMIVLPEVLTIKELADKMKQKPADLIKKLFMKGQLVTLNSELTYEQAEELAMEYDILCEKEVQVDVIEELLKEEEEDEALMKKRPPVVCVMGHVDHGKTSLLDAIRETNVTSREAGGITQHIGAYMVECRGEKITFLDTPGHEAFTAMRMRGAQATDIAVLVVAADDGVMPQTVEAINHAKAAGVEIIVAVNKIDKPAANVDRVKQELSDYGLIPEDWGGSTIFVPVSAKTRENIDLLLEMILLVTEVQELKANPNREMRGIVIEAKLDKGRGPVATVLVQKGTLKPGDFVSAGAFYGRVRAMLDADGIALKSATPSTPVEILGLNGVPNAGEICIGHKNEKESRAYAETFIAEEKKKMLAETKGKLTIDNLYAEIQAGNIKELPIVVKADVQGSVEAVRQSLEKLSNEEVAVKVIHGGVGAISESDVSLASASNAIIIGFNVKPDNQAKLLADSEHVDLRLYRVIYQAIDDVEAAMKGMLAPVYEEKVLGHAEVRMIFKASGVGTIAGSYVLDGTIERGCSARITRGKEQIFDGAVASLKRFKDDVREVREGYECGLVFEHFNDLMEGDLIEAYKMVEVERS
ncbi:MAG: translation initiation factor IF-2 [Lachnospiraceae bacterium]|nr:translation initiation factor IF-2 [Lachnospiraceae bacterium]